MLGTLCELGLRDLAYTLITNTEYPGWGFSIVNGSTTIWEHWDSFTFENGIRKGMNSFNHYSFGACTEWMYEYCLGIRPDEEKVGLKKVSFKPFMDKSGKITSASGHYDSDFGKIEISWQRDGDIYTYTVSAPQKIETEFEFKDMEIISKEHSEGNHIFTLKF